MMRAWQGGFGTVAVVGMVSPAYVVARPRTRFLTSLVEAQLRTPNAVVQMKRQSRGITDFRLRLYWEEFKEIRVTLPPAKEQDSIDAFITRESARIDALVAEQQRLIELLKEKRQAVISHAVTKGLDPNAKMKPSGFEWLGDVPAHWEVKRLKHVSPFLSVGIVINPSSLVADEGLPFIYGGDIREGVIDWGNARRITPEASHLHAKTVLEDGDLLVVRVGAPGVTAVVPAECAGGNCASVMLMRRGNFNSRWLCSLMNTRVVRFQVEGAQYGAAQEQFNISDAVNFWVPVPPREEQDQIQAHCDNAAGQFDKLVEGAKMAITLLQERRTALISAAVTGQIDVRSLEPRGSLECNAGSKKDDASLTISEAAFEAFCTDVSIPFVRIPRKQNERTADYLVNSGAQQFVVELKQFDPNEEEEAAIAARAEGKIVAQGGVPGSRIRLAIQNAAPQLKLSSGGRLPAMLVVYNCTGVNMHTDPYSVATAMQGLDVIDIAVPAETSESPNFGPPRSGPKKKMTANSHTSISAIAVLGDNLDGRMRLDVFHNRHAKNPLDPDKLRGPRVHHWRLPDGARSSLVEWDPV
jgi:type I restriction enzyme S subunit